MKRSWMRCGLILAGVIVGAALGGDAAIARINDGNWEAGGYLIYENFSNSTGISPFLGLGARGAYFFQAANGLELDFDTGSGKSSDNSDGSFDVRKLGLSYIHNFTLKTKEKVTPLITITAGNISVGDGNDTASTPFYGAGGGFRYFYNPRLALRVDTRVYRWIGDGTVVPHTPYYSFDLTVGVSFVIGAAK